MGQQRYWESRGAGPPVGALRSSRWDRGTRAALAGVLRPTAPVAQGTASPSEPLAASAEGPVRPVAPVKIPSLLVWSPLLFAFAIF